ncbi:MAG: 3-deoxy-8-phosphooctulonate synthase [Planctomycetes bacterium]|nr:3-deoxy-8-phosphooctulonate synthase [Planctomycetota bacterium]
MKHTPLDFSRFFAKDTPAGRRGPLVVIAGPCLLESHDMHRRIADELCRSCGRHGMVPIFKGSFDKANRSSVRSPRGPGIDAGCEMLARVRSEFGVALTTDIHEPAQAARVAATVDMIQIPAFLCRQTDLLAAAGATGRAVNIKKGQFMAPSEMRGAVGKVHEAGSQQVMLTDRGTFFGYHRLVNDFVGLADMAELGVPVCLDATHSTQRPGEGETSGGHGRHAPMLARAAVAAGVDAVFLECHPDPASSPSDRSTILPLAQLDPLLMQLAAIRQSITA